MSHHKLNHHQTNNDKNYHKLDDVNRSITSIMHILHEKENKISTFGLYFVFAVTILTGAFSTILTKLQES